VAHMLPFPDGVPISTGSALPDIDIFLNREGAQAKGGFRPRAERTLRIRESMISPSKNTLTWRDDNNQTAHCSGQSYFCLGSCSQRARLTAPLMRGHANADCICTHGL
jgi:hypothetical protein